MRNRDRWSILAVVALGWAGGARREARARPAAPVELKPGTERWAIKTGTDPEARSVPPAPVETTVEQLLALPRPADLPASGTFPAYESKRIEPAEATVYTVEADLIRYDMGEDGDFRMVLRGASGKTFDAAIPLPRFVESTSAWASQIAAARRYFEVRFTPVVDEAKHVDTRVLVTGVGFFGPIRPKSGGAENGFELHPILKMKWLVKPSPPKRKKKKK